MNRVEQFLTKQCVHLNSATLTTSEYYQFGTIKIRYSSHYSSTNNADVQIIKSTGGNQTSYAVFWQESKRLIIVNAKELVYLMSAFNITNSMSQQDIRTDYGDVTLYEPQEDMMNQNIILHSRNKTWLTSEMNQIAGMLRNQFGTSKGFTEKFQSFTRNYKLSGIELLTIYHQLFKVMMLSEFDTTKAREVLFKIRKN